MTSIGSPPNAPSAPSAALTTPACEHDESTLTPRPRTHAARNRSSRIKGSCTVCPSRTVWCPTNPASYDVTRSISPLSHRGRPPHFHRVADGPITHPLRHLHVETPNLATTGSEIACES